MSDTVSPLQPSIDYLLAHDEALADEMSIPVATPFRRYGRRELYALSPEELRGVARERQAAPFENVSAQVQAILNTQQIPLVLGSPDVARATPELMSGQPSLSKEVLTPRFPVMSLVRTAVDADRSRSNNTVRDNLGWEAGGNFVMQAPQPLPVVLSYTLEFLARTSHHINAMDTAIMQVFGIYHRPIYVDLGPPWGKVYTAAEISYPYQDSSTTSGEPGQKLMRHVYTVLMYGSIPRPPSLVRTVRTTSIGVEVAGEEGLESPLPLLPSLLF